MHKKTLNAPRMCGLMIGPILGSGIFILPPLVHAAVGVWALPAWGITVVLNAIFAFVFGFLSVQFPGDGGAADAIAHVLGARAKRLASYYLISAVVFGPAAVLLTIARYLPIDVLDTLPGGRMTVALMLVPVGYALLMLRIRAIGTLALVLSSISTVLLLGGSILVLGYYSNGSTLQPELGAFDSGTFGHALLMLFWIIVGWEVVGNYSGEVEAPQRTIPRAVMGSVVAVTLVELCVAVAMYRADVPETAGYGMARLMYPVFGTGAAFVCSLLVTALCITTYLMFVGGVARLMASLGEGGGLPRFTARRNSNGVPVASLTILCCMQAASLGACLAGIAQLETLVAIASGFFLANALIGIGAAVIILPGLVKKLFALLLAAVLMIVLVQSAWFVLLAISVMAAACLSMNRRALKPQSAKI